MYLNSRSHISFMLVASTTHNTHSLSLSLSLSVQVCFRVISAQHFCILSLSLISLLKHLTVIFHPVIFDVVHFDQVNSFSHPCKVLIQSFSLFHVLLSVCLFLLFLLLTLLHPFLPPVFQFCPCFFYIPASFIFLSFVFLPFSISISILCVYFLFLLLLKEFRFYFHRFFFQLEFLVKNTIKVFKLIFK